MQLVFGRYDLPSQDPRNTGQFTHYNGDVLDGNNDGVVSMADAGTVYGVDISEQWGWLTLSFGEDKVFLPNVPHRADVFI